MSKNSFQPLYPHLNYHIMVSIIIPMFNAAAFLRDTLRSVSTQSYTDWECICVDDGSKDESLSIAEAFAMDDLRIKVFERPAHMAKGGNNCRNYGFERSKGNYIQWFDADDLMLPTLLEDKLQALVAKPEIDFVVSYIGELEDGKIFHKAYAADSPQRLQDFLAYKIYFLTAGPLFRKEFLVGKLLFSPILKRHQEWEFYSRLLIGGCHYQVLDQYHALRRFHDASINGVHQQKTGLQRVYIKLFAVDVMHRNLDGKAVRLLFSVFYKVMLWAILESFKKLNFKHLPFFTRQFMEFSMKSLFRKDPPAVEKNYKQAIKVR